MAPNITSTTPENSATNVYVNQLIYVVFDVPLLESSVSLNTFLMYRASDYRQVEGTISYDSDLYTTTFIPDKVLDSDTSYTFIVVGEDQSADCVKSADLDELEESYAIQFVTGSEVYEEPQETEEQIEMENAYAPVPTIPVYEAAPDPDFVITEVYPENRTTNVGTIIDGGKCFIVQLSGADLPPSRIILNDLYPEYTVASGYYSLYSEFNDTLSSDDDDYLDWMSVEASPVNGDPSILSGVPAGFIVPPSGNKTMYWTALDPSGWYQNNEVVVTVSKKVTNDDGGTLLQAQKFFFTTAYRPLYCTVQKIRLAIGPYIKDFPDDTINRTIFNNSLLAYQMSNEMYSQSQWGIDSPSFAAKMYTCCKTQYDLLTAKLLDKSCNSGQMKTLGDLSIQDPLDISKAISVPLESAIACMTFWVDQMIGKEGKVHPKMAIKGVTNASTPPVRGVRTWVKDPRGIPASNTKTKRRNKVPSIYSRWS